jgi:hypothetical protein
MVTKDPKLNITRFKTPSEVSELIKKVILKPFRKEVKSDDHQQQ